MDHIDVLKQKHLKLQLHYMWWMTLKVLKDFFLISLPFFFLFLPLVPFYIVFNLHILVQRVPEPRVSIFYVME